MSLTEEQAASPVPPTASPAPVISPQESVQQGPIGQQKLYRYYFKPTCVYCKYFEVHLDLHPALKQYVEFIDISDISPLPQIKGVPTIVNLRNPTDSYLGPRCLWWLRGMIIKLAESLPVRMPERHRLEEWFGVAAPAPTKSEEFADSPFQSQDIDENQEESGAVPASVIDESEPPTSFADLAAESDGIRVLVPPEPVAEDTQSTEGSPMQPPLSEPSSPDLEPTEVAPSPPIGSPPEAESPTTATSEPPSVADVESAAE